MSGAVTASRHASMPCAQLPPKLPVYTPREGASSSVAIKVPRSLYFFVSAHSLNVLSRVTDSSIRKGLYLLNRLNTISFLHPNPREYYRAGRNGENVELHPAPPLPTVISWLSLSACLKILLQLASCNILSSSIRTLHLHVAVY